jgi:xanthine dehydrogenase accessory factor
VRELLADLERWRRRGDRVAVATVVATRRSAPRPIGSKLVVSEAGEMAGSVSGGCVENEVYGCAREILAGGPPRLLTYGISDDEALEVGLPCGGEIDVHVSAPAPELLERLGRVADAQERAVVFTELDGSGQVLVLETGETVGAASEEVLARATELIRGGRSRVVEVDGRSVFADVFGPPPRVLVFGAVDTAEALCRIAGAAGWRTIVADARAKFATHERLPSADEIVVAWPDDALAQVRPDHSTAVVVLTHEDRFDIPALKGALETDAFYVGALGARRNQARRRERLLEDSVADEDIDRIAGPAGLDIGASSPAEVAVSILAEILARRAGRSGGPLKDAKGRIHAGQTARTAT